MYPVDNIRNRRNVDNCSRLGTDHLPSLDSKSQTFRIPVGEGVVLPCQVQYLGELSMPRHFTQVWNLGTIRLIDVFRPAPKLLHSAQSRRGDLNLSTSRPLQATSICNSPLTPLSSLLLSISPLLNPFSRSLLPLSTSVLWYYYGPQPCHHRGTRAGFLCLCPPLNRIHGN